MSTSSVRNAIQKALTTNAKPKAEVTRDEARAILKAATTEPKGPAVIGKEEAALLGRLAGKSSFSGAPGQYSVTAAAQKELEAFFVANRLPFGENAAKMRSAIEGLISGLDLSTPQDLSGDARGLHELKLSGGRVAYVNSARGEFLLKTGDKSWFGPISLKGAPPAPAGNREADLAKLKGEIAAATKDLLYMSESDYPFDLFLKAGAGTSKPTAAQMLALLGKPAGTVVETRSFDEFFGRLTTPQEWWGDEEKATGAKYQALATALKGGLTDLQVFKVGEIEVGVYIVGRNAHGDLVGVSTTSIET